MKPDRNAIVIALWTALMPAQFPLPDEWTLYRWGKHHESDPPYAIREASEKMKKLIARGEQVNEDSAARYTSAILGARAEWRRQMKQGKREGEL